MLNIYVSVAVGVGELSNPPAFFEYASQYLYQFVSN